MEGGLDEIRDEAIPFRDGDEVLVTIVEPHMYEVDDAVAKIDGYIVSVAGGGAHVGEKRLVRIVEAGRTAASAVLVDNGASPTPAKAPAKPRATATKPRATAAKRPAAARKPAAASAAPRRPPRPTRTRRRRGRASRRKPAADPVEEAPDDAAASDADGAATPADAAGGDEAPATPRRRTRRKPAPVDPEAEALEQQADDAEDAVGADAPEGSGEGDAVESKPRRRGRRGGRRRSAAKAEATPAD